MQAAKAGPPAGGRGAGIPAWHVLPTAVLRPRTPAAEPLTWPVGSGQCHSGRDSGLPDARPPAAPGVWPAAPAAPVAREAGPPLASPTRLRPALCPGLPGPRGDAAPEAEAGPPERVLAGLREPAGAGQGGRGAPPHPEPLGAAGKAGCDGSLSPALDHTLRPLEEGQAQEGPVLAACCLLRLVVSSLKRGLWPETLLPWARPGVPSKLPGVTPAQSTAGPCAVPVEAEGRVGSSCVGREAAGQGLGAADSCAPSVRGPDAVWGQGGPSLWREPAGPTAGGNSLPCAAPRCTRAIWTTLGTRITPGSRRWPSASTSQTRATRS